MADKKESALGAVTDFAQARVLDASGASKNISKADMASVLAGVMNPLIVADGNGIDFNKTKTFQNRIYHIGNINNQTTNPPISTSSSAIYVNIGNENRVCEMLFGVEQSFIFSRYNGGDWKRVDNWG